MRQPGSEQPPTERAPIPGTYSSFDEWDDQYQYPEDDHSYETEEFEIDPAAPDPEAVQKTYKRLIEIGLYYDVERLRKETGLLPDPAVVQSAYRKLAEDADVFSLVQTHMATGVDVKLPAETVERLHRRLLNQGLTRRIQELESLTGNGPDPKLIQEVYAEKLRRGEAYILKQLFDLFGLKAEVDAETIRQGYETAIRSGDYSAIRIIRDVTGVALPPETVQQGYDAFVKKGDNYSIRRLEAETGIKPEFSDEAVRRGYMSLLDPGKGVLMLGTLKAFERTTGRMPDPDLVRNAYRGLAEYGNADSIGILETFTQIRPEIEPVAVQKMYLFLFRHGRVNEAETLTQRFGVDPDPKIVQQGFDRLLRGGDWYSAMSLKAFSGQAVEFKPRTVQRAYAVMLRNENIDNFKELERVSGIPADPQMIQKAFTELLRRNKLLSVVRLAKETGLKPDIDPKEVQAAFARLVKQKEYDRLAELIAATGEAPEPATVERVYADLLAIQSFGVAARLMEASGVKPEIRPDRAREIYAALLVSGRYLQMQGLERLTGIAPDPRLVQDRCRDLLFNGDILRVEELMEATGVKPEMDPEFLQSAYKLCFQRNGLDGMLRLRNLTGADPEPDVIRFVYLELLRAGSISKIEQLQTAFKTAVEFDPREVQAVYVSIIKDGNWAGVKSLRKLTGIEPDAKTIQDAYAWYIRQGFTGSIAGLTEMLGVPPAPAVIQEAYKGLLQTAQFGSVDELIKATGLKPALDPADVQAAYRNLIQRERFGQLPEIKKYTGIDLAPEAVAEAVKLAWQSQPQSVAEILLAFPNAEIDWKSIDPHADSDVYASARNIANKDLFRNAWEFFSNVELLTTEEGARFAAAAPNVPAYLRGMMLRREVGPDWPIIGPLNRAYADAQARKKGAAEMSRRAEFALVTLMTKLSAVNLEQYRPAFEAAITPETPPEKAVELLDTLAALINLRQSINKMVKEAEGVPIQHGAPPAVSGFDALLEWVKGEQRRLSETVLGYAPSPENARRLETEWGSPRPLYVLAAKYQSGYRQGMPLFSKAAAAIYEDRWRTFRYEDPEAQGLLAGLTPEQRKQWIANLPRMPLEDVRVSETKAEQVLQRVRETMATGLDQGYLYSAQNPETAWAHNLYLWMRGAVKNEGGFSKERLGDAVTLVGLELFRRTRLASVLKELGITAGPEKADPREVLDRAREKADEFRKSLAERPSSKAESALGRVEAAARWAEEFLRLEPELEALRGLAGVKEGDDVKTVAAAREQLRLAEDLVRLTSLSFEEIRFNAVREKGALKRGALLAWIEQLSGQLRNRGSAFAQTLDNVRQAVAGDRQATNMQGLTIEETDHPKDMFEHGKYPIGATSCQNYEGQVSYNKCLVGTVADADKKLILVRKADGTIVARVIVKMVWQENGSPALFLEPTYTGIRKSDHDFDPDIDAFLHEKAAAMGGIAVMRGSVEVGIRVTVRASRNGWQYEDGATGGPNNAGLGEKSGMYTMDAKIVPAP